MVLFGVAFLISFSWLTRFALSGRLRSLFSVDDYLLFFPAYEIGARWFARGVLPLWNPYALCGIPWIAALQEGFLYPPHVLYLLLPTPTAFAASTVFHLIFIGISTVLFARRAGLGYAPAVLAAVLFVLRGTTILFAATEPPQLEASAWLPLGALAVVDLARGGGRRPVAILALSTSLSILAGYPQITVYLVYTWVALLIALLVGGRPGVRRGVAAAGLFAAGLALGALGGGAQLLPSAELLRLGTRSSQSLTVDAMFPLVGYVFGNPGFRSLGEAVAGSSVSFGVVGLAFAAAAPFAARRRPLALWALVCCALTLVFALGPLTPFFQLYRALPTLSWFRLPNRVLCVTDFAFATTAAVGFDAALAVGDRMTTTPRARIRLPGAVLAALLAPAASLLVIVGVGESGDWRPALVAAGGIAALAALAWSRPSRRPPIAGALVALAVIEIFLTPPLDEILPYTSSATAVYRKHEKTFVLLGRIAMSQRVWVLNWISPDVAQKRLAVYGLRSFDDYEPVNPLRQSQYYTYFVDGAPTVSHWPWLFPGNLINLKPYGQAPPLQARRRLLDLAAVRFVVMHRAALLQPEVRDFVQAAGLQRWWMPLPREPATPTGEELVVFENPHALPRAYVVYRSRPAPEVSELLGRISQDGFDPLVESYVEGAPPIAGGPGSRQRGAAAPITLDEERVVEVEPTLASPGFLVLADSFYPGWQATVDGAPAPILPANHLFRAVPVPAGRHRVRFEYRPWSFTLGAGASLASLAVIIFLLRPGREASSRTLTPTSAPARAARRA